MPAIITLKDIEETINNLNYKSETTLKSKLIRAVRNFYSDESSVNALTSIDVAELVKYVWDTGDDSALIKNKRKNFSTVKSSVNTDLKKLYQEGKNPQGIIINYNNVFDISDEAKNKALSGIADILRERATDTSSKINEILPSPEKSGEESASETTQGNTLADITAILQDREIDVQNKVNHIMAAVQEMLTSAISLAGPELNSEEAGQIKDFLGNLVQTSATMFPQEDAGVETGIETGSEVKSEAGEEGAETDIAGQIAEAEIEEIVEVIEESDDAQLMTETSDSVEEIDISSMEEFAADAGIEEILLDQDVDAGATSEELVADEVIEIVEDISEDEFSESTTDAEITTEATPKELAADDSTILDGELTASGIAETEQSEQHDGTAPEDMDYEEIIEVVDSGAPPPAMMEEEADAVESVGEEIVPDDTIVEALETIPEDYELAQTGAEEPEAVEIVEEAADDEVEEIIEELVGDEEQIGSEAIDGDLRTKADILEQLAAAAKALEKIGPDLSNSIYSEEEIKEKAELLSEEFDRYLSIREKFYNQHILIKSGNYPIGKTGGDKNELPAQIANLREFYIGKFPVTNALFEIFVEKTGYITTAEKHGFGFVYIPRMQKIKNAQTGMESFIWNNQLQHKRISGACWYRPSGPASTLYLKRTHPVVQVSLEDACAFAAWTGKRIPTEKEWEAAARTSRSNLYPWGNAWQDDACNLEKSLLGDTSPVDQYVKFANAYEVTDTLGNVLEWTLDTWQIPSKGEESEETYVVKGASWISDSAVDLTDRRPIYKDASSNILGFRCIAI